MALKPKKWLLNILISIDQFANAITFGSPDKTISARIGRQKEEGRLNWFTRILDHFLEWLDPGHTLDALRTEREGGHGNAFDDTDHSDDGV